jgi:antirestriction protein
MPGRLVTIRLNQWELELIRALAHNLGISEGMAVKFACMEYVKNDFSIQESPILDEFKTLERIMNLKRTIKKIQRTAENALREDGADPSSHDP